MTIMLSRYTRAAADAARLTIELPDSVGALEWHGLTKMAGPGFAHAFTLVQKGGNSALPTHIFPGGRVETFRRHGYDLTLYESIDRTNSCLVWVGPFNEAKTWFAGPAPRRSVLNALVAAVEFTDSPEGATLRPRLRAATQQFATKVIGRNDRLIVMAGDARAARETLPDFQGARRGDAEVWKIPLDLDPEQKARVGGTPYEHKYIYANSTAVFTVQFTFDPEASSFRAADDGFVEDVLAGFKVAWAA
ncbi:hypothetical protein ABT158_48905 [Nonomuraea sp. NPDC001636]|uniref:hypothetical protein n=1 Tax=Nonomuraea sp. NPDC001636 TaxID=3154391 RepID=UPI00332FD40B